MGIYFKLFIGIEQTPKNKWLELIQWKGSLPSVLRDTIFKDVSLQNKVFQVPVQVAYDRINIALKSELQDNEKSTIMDIYDEIAHEGRNSGIDSDEDAVLILDLSDAIDQNYWQEE